MPSLEMIRTTRSQYTCTNPRIGYLPMASKKMHETFGESHYAALVQSSCSRLVSILPCFYRLDLHYRSLPIDWCARIVLVDDVSCRYSIIACLDWCWRYSTSAVTRKVYNQLVVEFVVWDCFWKANVGVHLEKYDGFERMEVVGWWNDSCIESHTVRCSELQIFKKFHYVAEPVVTSKI